MSDTASGIAYPFRIDPATGRVAIASGVDKLRQNIRLILGTRWAERALQRDVGTRIQSLVHDPNDAVLAELLQTQAQQALQQFEPRILITSAKVTQQEAGATLLLNYILIDTPIADQLLLPLS